MPASNVSASTTIAASPATVFAILADPRQHARIDGSGTVRGSLSGPERLELGSEFGMDMKMGAPYRIKNKVVELEEDRLIAWRHIGTHRWRYELAAQADGTTLVTETWDLSHCNGVTKWVLGAMGYPKRHTRGIEQTLVNLKAAAEADAAAEAG
ncbi:hypothetical protein GCM10009795_023610 [Nocardioides hankookensis]|uniref:SRPBCC family protein n=1 Tax=Nocardioides hankookensis TaxID=443157 RepID=A0ABW1LFP2_9ACTN